MNIIPSFIKDKIEIQKINLMILKMDLKFLLLRYRDCVVINTDLRLNKVTKEIIDSKSKESEDYILSLTHFLENNISEISNKLNLDSNHINSLNLVLKYFHQGVLTKDLERLDYSNKSIIHKLIYEIKGNRTYTALMAFNKIDCSDYIFLRTNSFKMGEMFSTSTEINYLISKKPITNGLEIQTDLRQRIEITNYGFDLIHKYQPNKTALDQCTVFFYYLGQETKNNYFVYASLDQKTSKKYLENTSQKVNI